MPSLRDSRAIVLDFLRHGKPGDRKAEPIAQCLGDHFFALLEVVLRENFEVKPGDRLQLEEREKVRYVRRISVNELTSYAKEELQKAVPQLVEENSQHFVKFFNTAGPLSTRLHSLELLPGIGKKYLWDILRERKRKNFESLEDVQQRIRLPDVKRILAKRVLKELEGKERHLLFVSPPTRERAP